MRVAGTVLCGGRSSRMGRPKAWLPIGGEFMLPRVLRILGQVASPLLAVAAVGQELPPLPDGTQIVRDELEGRGPLQGLAAALATLDGRADAAYLSSCDVPFLEPAFVRHMIELAGSYSACVPRVDGRDHPLAGVYRLDILGPVQQLLAADQLRMSRLFEVVPTRFVEVGDLIDIDRALRSLRNLNTPDDYDAALREVTGL
jgi:molybdopterin-guanine dinucleotide biosynthesis protein A